MNVTVSYGGMKIKMNAKVPRSLTNALGPRSHWHPDHTGDPSKFLSNVELVVGPGAKDFLLPGYPADPHGLILESDYAYA